MIRWNCSTSRENEFYPERQFRMEDDHMSSDPGKFPELFGSMVFNEETMKKRLSPSCYGQWKQSVSDGTPLDISTANEIAEAMKQ